MHDHGEHITLKIEGMDCANCALGITRKLGKSGHENIHVDFATGEASLVMAENATLDEVIHDIEKLGYHVVKGEEKRPFFGIEAKFWFCLVFTVPLFFGHMLFPHDSWIANPWTQLLLCLPVFAVGVMHFGKSALGSVKSGVPNMDVLIFIGSTAAFGYSLAGMLTVKDPHLVHNYMFFETTATIITLVLLGNVLEHRSVKRTTSAISELSSLQPETARKITVKDGKETITGIPASQLQTGDVLLVNAGESIPADGEVISGNGDADESMITGESVPAGKTTGSAVTGGTVLVNGPLRIRVTRTGADSTLSHIVAMVKKAQQEKPPVQQLADKISAIFVPVVLGISALTFLLSWLVFDITISTALMNSIAVLVISCPCAMGLATPTAVMVGIGRAAKQGILIRGGRTLEQLARIKTVVFDKTGTITTGRFSNIHIKLLGAIDEKRVKEILLGLEQNSAHPLAKSITGLLSGQGVQPASGLGQATEQKGIGVEATDADGVKWSAGSWRLLGENQKAHDIYLLRNGEPVAGVTLEDELRPGMKALIDFLHSKNIRTVLLSGDREEKCRIAAAAIGINEVYAEQLPEQKLELITKLSKENKTAMVGDGINDAPALARADIGISPGEATRSAMQSAQVILLGQGDLSRVQAAILVGQHSLRTIKQNLFWAFFYNVVAIPIAAVGLLSPMVAALSMAFSDVIVIGNSLRLRGKRLS